MDCHATSKKKIYKKKSVKIDQLSKLEKNKKNVEMKHIEATFDFKHINSPGGQTL